MIILFEYDIKIAFINVKIQSNLDIEKFIIKPEPYNLCINYCIKEVKEEKSDYKIIINNERNNNVKVLYENNLLVNIVKSTIKL